MKTLVAKKGEYGEKYLLGEVRYGGEATLKTYVAFCYTETSVKIKIEAYGDDFYSPYKGDYKNEQVWNADAVEIFLSPYGSEEWYYEVDFAPTGAWFTAHLFNPDGHRGYCHGEDGPAEGVVWDIKVENGCWTTEVEIPFAFMIKNEEDLKKALSLPWRGNIYRIDIKNDEYLSACPTNCDEINFHVPQGFGRLIFE